MKHGSEKVLLYQFTDEARLESISNLFKKLNKERSQYLVKINIY